MARIKLSGLIDDIRGKMGGTVFSVWKAGCAVARKAAPIRQNPRSSDQQLMRDFLQWLSGLWFSFLTQAQRDLWDDYAATEAAGRHGGAAYSGGSGNIIPGNTGIMSGFNAFLMINQRMVVCGMISDYDTAGIQATPPVKDPSPMVEDLAVVWNTPAFDFTWTAAAGADAADMLRIWVRSYNTGCHRQLRNCVLVSTAAQAISTAKFTKGAALPFLNKLGFYDFQVDVLNDEGVLSAPSAIITVEAT